MKARGKRIGRGEIWILPALIAVTIALLVYSGIALAQGPPNVITLSGPIKINASPTSVPADGVSTSEITIAVFNPKIEECPRLGEIEGYEEIFAGKPAAGTRVDVKTTLGNLLDTNNTNNTGKEITVFTDNNGVASVLLSGNETGVANIIAEAVSIENIINSIRENDTSIYLVKNSTTVTLLEAGATPAPGNGGGNGGIPPMPPAGTSPYLKISANPADIPADGVSTSTITASVWNGEEWVPENLTVNFSTSLGNITRSAVIMNGTATAILTAGLEEGVATITGEANLGGDIGTLTNTTTVNFTAPGATPTPPVLTTPTSLTPAVTVSPTPAATVSPTPTSSPARKSWIPGFEVAFAIAGLLTVAYLVLRGGRKE